MPSVELQKINLNLHHIGYTYCVEDIACHAKGAPMTPDLFARLEEHLPKLWSNLRQAVWCPMTGGHRWKQRRMKSKALHFTCVRCGAHRSKDWIAKHPEAHIHR
jgi:hypothetical protein